MLERKQGDFVLFLSEHSWLQQEKQYRKYVLSDSERKGFVSFRGQEQGTSTGVEFKESARKGLKRGG